MSDTPRTDSNLRLGDPAGELVMADFARILEREVYEAQTIAELLAVGIESGSEVKQRVALTSYLVWRNQKI